MRPAPRTTPLLFTLALLLAAPPARAAEPAPAGATGPVDATAPAGGVLTPEQAETLQVLPPVPVTFDGRFLFMVRGGVPGLSPATRAAAIEKRLRAAAEAPGAIGPVRVVEGYYSDIFAGDRFLASITDAEAGGRAQRAFYAASIARDIEEALQEYRRERTPEALVRSWVKVIVATGVLLVLLLGLRLFRIKAGPALARRAGGLLSRLRVQGLELIRPEAQERLVRNLGWSLHAVVVLIVLLTWLQVVLHFLPWTRDAADRSLGFVARAVWQVVAGVLGYLPNLVYIALFALLGYGANQLNRLFFRAVGAGAVRLPGFWP
jgi:hypothetical protein